MQELIDGSNGQIMVGEPKPIQDGETTIEPQPYPEEDIFGKLEVAKGTRGRARSTMRGAKPWNSAVTSRGPGVPSAADREAK